MQLSELVRRIRSGEKEAVKELVATYGSAVYQRAFERTNDKELAREAARQTFGQFVAIVQQQPQDDGWTLWFGDLIEKNISTYAQISTDMRTIESELDHELVETPPAYTASPAYAAAPAYAAPASAAQPAAKAQESFIWRAPEPETPPRRTEPPQLNWREAEEPLPPRAPEKAKRNERKRKPDERENKPEPRVHKDNVRDEIFDEPYRKKAKSGAGHGFSIVLLILVSLLLLWVVVGVAMTLQWIPWHDLGFTWFNQNVFKLF